jgi:uncharacterized membrane protein HdeD (DUF308 family)
MTTVVEIDEYEVSEGPPHAAWGWYLAAGLAWFVIGLGVLSWSPATISLIGIAVAVVVMLAGIMELVLAWAADGWRWLHAIAGVFFLIVGVLALLSPFQTFASIAMLFGWYLVIKGAVVLTIALATRIPGTLWGLAVFVGLLDIALGLWAIGYPGRSAWLLVLWVGIGCIFHGIGDIVSAFHVRSAR